MLTITPCSSQVIVGYSNDSAQKLLALNGSFAQI